MKKVESDVVRLLIQHVDSLLYNDGTSHECRLTEDSHAKVLLATGKFVFSHICWAIAIESDKFNVVKPHNVGNPSAANNRIEARLSLNSETVNVFTSARLGMSTTNRRQLDSFTKNLSFSIVFLFHS